MEGATNNFQFDYNFISWYKPVGGRRSTHNFLSWSGIFLKNLSQAPANNNELILQAPYCSVQCYSIILLISQLLLEKTSSFARDHSARHILWRIIGKTISGLKQKISATTAHCIWPVEKVVQFQRIIWFLCLEERRVEGWDLDRKM